MAPAMGDVFPLMEINKDGPVFNSSSSLGRISAFYSSGRFIYFLSRVSSKTNDACPCFKLYENIDPRMCGETIEAMSNMYHYEYIA